eukprot:IDg5664t1
MASSPNNELQTKSTMNCKLFNGQMVSVCHRTSRAPLEVTVNNRWLWSNLRGYSYVGNAPCERFVISSVLIIPAPLPMFTAEHFCEDRSSDSRS